MKTTMYRYKQILKRKEKIEDVNWAAHQPNAVSTSLIKKKYYC